MIYLDSKFKTKNRGGVVSPRTLKVLTRKRGEGCSIIRTAIRDLGGLEGWLSVTETRKEQSS